MVQTFPVDYTRVERALTLLFASDFSMTSRFKSQIKKQTDTDKSTSWLFRRYNSRNLTEITTAAKTSQNKGFNELYVSAHVINLCTFLSQPT